MSHSKAEFGALSVLGGVEAYAIHLQPACHLQQLEVRLRWCVPAVNR